MLVCRNVVKDALEWLKLNHTDYKDLQISLENLNNYPLVGVPVNIEYSKLDPDCRNKIAAAMSVYNNEIKDGTTDGPCSFTVHGLTGPEFESMSMDRLKAGVTESFLLTKRRMWPDISNCLKSLNHDILKNTSDKLSNGKHFLPATPGEKKLLSAFT
jgi:hypothetical protein